VGRDPDKTPVTLQRETAAGQAPQILMVHPAVGPKLPVLLGTIQNSHSASGSRQDPVAGSSVRGSINRMGNY
jgi:hypothetical protein